MSLDYDGIVAPVVLGRYGVNATKNQQDAKLGELLKASSIVYTDRTVQKEPGAALYGSAIATAPRITAVRHWHPSSGTERLVTFAAGTLYMDDGAGDLDANTLASGLSAGARPFFVEGGQEDVGAPRKLFAFTGADAVRVVSGIVVPATSLALPPADWTGANQPIAGVQHNKSLFAFGNLNDPHRIYKSSVTNHEDFTTTVYDELVEPGIGHRLCAGISFNTRLWLFKTPKGICFLHDPTADPAAWRFRTKSTELGIPESPYAALAIDDDILFIAPDASFHLLSQVLTEEAVRDSDISHKFRFYGWLKENVNIGRLHQVTSHWDSRLKVARFGLPSIGSTVNDLTLYLDFADWQSRKVVKFSWSPRDSAEAFTSFQDATLGDRPMVGGAEGVVYRLDQEALNRAGEAYTAEFQTAFMDFHEFGVRVGASRKQFDFLEAVFSPQGQWDLAVDVLVDGEYVETVQFNMGAGGAALDAFVLDEDVLAGDTVATVRHRIHGSGQRLSLVGRQSGLNQGFSLAQFNVYFRPMAKDFR